MPTFYNFRQNGVDYSFDDVFVPAEWFSEGGDPGSLWSWGRRDNGELGNGVITILNTSTPVTTFAGGSNWKQISCGYRFTAAIKNDGTLWTWGRGNGGALGNNSTLNVSTPVTTFAGGNNWRQVWCDSRISAAIKEDGTLWTWGNGRDGALGNLNVTDRSTPVTTFAGGTNWKQVSCSGYGMAAIKTDGTLWTWGIATGGRLGANTAAPRSTPITTFAGGANWRQLNCGGNSVAAIKTDGTLWIWGSSPSLGTGSSVSVSTPVTTFAGGSNWKQVAVGYNTAAIKTDGTLWVWGRGDNGRLGTASTSTVSTPVTTFAGGNNWKQVSVSKASVLSGNTAAIKTNGTLWTWGGGNYGHLGNASVTNVSTPVTTFAGRTTWKQVSCGAFTMVAVTYD